MSIEANKDVVRQYLGAWEKGDTDTLKSLLAQDAVTHVNAGHDSPSLQFEPFACDTWNTSFPDTKLTIEKLVAEGDSVSAYWVIDATHTADFMNIPATNKKVKLGGLEINRVKDGKIVEIWRISDTITLMEQLQASSNHLS